MQIRAEGWNDYIERHLEQRWAPVCRAWFPEGTDSSLDWTWTFVQYVFPLGDPRNLTRVDGADWSSAERRVLARYVSHARDLAGGTLLTARNGYSVHLPTAESDPEVTETTSNRDATVGFLTMLRQCYSPNEDASFKRAYDLVGREIHKSAGDTAALKAWRRAHAALRANHLDHLILVRAAADGLVPKALAAQNAHSPSEVDSPHVMLAAVFYGDAIHWGDQRKVIEAWNSEHEVFRAKRRFDALRAAVHLGHLYVGFAAVVGAATGDLDLADP